MTDSRFAAETVLAGLKDFQRRAVDHVFDELHAPDGSGRFLVADETGLGKSIVARGLIARTIEKLQDDEGVDRIDIVYVCSNTDLARQNIGRLNVTSQEQIEAAVREIAEETGCSTRLGRRLSTVAYDVAVSGNQAVNLVEVAEQSGNVRVTFSGRYRVTEYKGEQGTRLQHEVRADEVAVSLRGQSVRVVGKPTADQGDDTPF